MSIDRLERLIKILTFTRWFVVAIILVLIFWQPITNIVTYLPLLAGKSQSISIGSMSMKIKNQMAEKPTPHFNQAVYGLTPDQLIEVASLKESGGKSTAIKINESYYLENVQQLEQKGLVTVSDDRERDSLDLSSKHYIYTPTPLGIKSSKIMNDLIDVFIDQLTTSKDSSKRQEKKL